MRASIRSALPVLIFALGLAVLGAAACTAAGPAGGVQLDRIKLPPGFSIRIPSSSPNTGPGTAAFQSDTGWPG